MKITYRALDRLELAFMEEGPEFDIAAKEPRHTAPMEMRYTWYKVDRVGQDVPVVYRGDTLVLETTLLDVRGNAFPGLDTALSIKLGVKKMVPVQEILFELDGTLVSALTGRVDFTFTPTETDQPYVDEAILTVRVERAAGEYTSFETDMVHFRSNAFTPSP